MRLLIYCSPLIMLGFAACSDNGGTTEPEARTDLRVSVSTTGADLDHDGYAIFLSGGTVPPRRVAVEIEEAVVFEDLPDGSITLTLEGVAANCATAEPNPRTVERVDGTPDEMAFTVTCEANPRFRPAEIAAGGRVTCAVMEGGDGYCWGSGYQVGSRDASMGSCGHMLCVPRPTLVAGGHEWATIRPSGGYVNEAVCGLTTTGAAYCWGEGIVGDGSGSDDLAFEPRPVFGDRTYSYIAVGSSACGISEEGQTFCWGENSRGEVGDGTVDARKLPVPMANDPGFVELALGYRFGCGRTAGGVVHCWGDNNVGQLGRGTADPSPHPLHEPVAGGVRFASIEAAADEVCGMSTEGEPYCWGAEHGPAPVPVAGDLGLVDITPGDMHTCGITAEGILYCWGYNGQGQIGVGYTAVTELPPTVIGEGRVWAAVDASYVHTCALDADGTAFCWGSDFFAQLGTWGSPTRPTEVIGPDA